MWPSRTRAPTRPRRRRFGTPTSRLHGAGTTNPKSASSSAWSPPSWRECRIVSAISTRSCARCGCSVPARLRSSTTRRSPGCWARKRRESCRRLAKALRRCAPRPRNRPSECCARRARTPSICVTTRPARPIGVATTPTAMPRRSWRWPSSRVGRWSRRPGHTGNGCSASCLAAVIWPASRSTNSSTGVIGSSRRSNALAWSPPMWWPSWRHSAS